MTHSAGDPAAGFTVNLDLHGCQALVTGAGSGIGEACARRLAAAGAHVVVADVNVDAANRVATEVGGSTWTVDLAEPSVADNAGPDVDVLVNNAGLQHVAPVQDFPPDMFARILRVMLETPFRLAQRVLPHMYERGWGRIVNISSVHGLRASPYKAAYISAKHGLEGLSKALALEGASLGVTSNCINPGYVRTPLVEGQIAAQAKAHGLSEDDVIERVMLQPAAIKRLVEPAEVAELVAYVCGPYASFMTGSSLPLDGGWTAR